MTVSERISLFIPFSQIDIGLNYFSLQLVFSVATCLIFQSLDQGLTKAWLERDQMALGVFSNCHECQQIDFLALKKTFGYLLVDRKPMGFWKFQGNQVRAVALRHVRYLHL